VIFALNEGKEKRGGRKEKAGGRNRSEQTTKKREGTIAEGVSARKKRKSQNRGPEARPVQEKGRSEKKEKNLKRGRKNCAGRLLAGRGKR